MRTATEEVLDMILLDKSSGQTVPAKIKEGYHLSQPLYRTESQTEPDTVASRPDLRLKEL